MNDIEIKNMCKSFGPKVIFDDFSLTVKQGDYVALVGPSGCGKTTLLNIMGLLEPPDSGDVVIGDVVNPHLDRKDGRKILKNRISYIFQNYGLIERLSVFENLKVATRFLKISSKEKKEIISDALNRVGLKGYEKAKAYQLSGGEQQRIAIARVMIKPCKIILADEPTGSLDSDNRDQILGFLSDINKEGKTIVVVTHDKVVEKCANRSLKLY